MVVGQPLRRSSSLTESVLKLRSVRADADDAQGRRDGISGGRLLEDFERDQRRRNLAAGTILRRRTVLRAFLAGVDPVACSRVDIEAWLDSRNLSPRSRYTYRSSLKVFFDWLVRVGARSDNPCADTAIPHLPRLVPRPIDDADLARALGEADERMKAWLCLGAYQGFRVMEMANLRREAVLERRRPPLIMVERGKGGHQALLPLNEHTERALRVWGLDRRGFLFTTAAGRVIAPATVSRYIASYLRGLGIDATGHMLRHWHATRLWAATHDIRLTQEMMRHADPRTTSIYTAFDAQMAAEVVRKMSVDGGE